MHVNYRQGKKEDCRLIAELIDAASDGAVEYLFHGLIPCMSAVQLLTEGLRQDKYPNTFRSCIVAEFDNKVIGMALSYPSQYHCINAELRSLLPKDRLERFRDFYSSRVEGSFFLDAIGVDEHYRGKGIGQLLLEQTKQKARNEGFTELSLIVFSGNTKAIKLYEREGFKKVKNIALESHPLIPHEGGCLLMNCAL